MKPSPGAVVWPAGASHTKRVRLSERSSTRSASTSQPYSSADRREPSAAHGSSESRTMRTASAVDVAGTSSAPPRLSRRKRAALRGGLGVGEHPRHL